MSNAAFSYQAICNTDNGQIFEISVENKTLYVDGKYKHLYDGKTWNGWYEYSNSKYKYSTGPFESDGFEISVENYRNESYDGYCTFR
jgi:hypothetical protein